MKHHNSAKIHKTIVKGVSTLTAVSLLVPLVSSGGQTKAIAASTEGSATKSESVYVNVDSTGASKAETVSVWLHDDTSGAVIADQSQLSDIVNLKGDEKPQVSGDNLTWKLDGNDLYYQGKTTKQIPVSMNIQYFLNGQQISSTDIAGKSGKFELKITFENHDAHNVMISGQPKTIYTPFAVMAALDLPEKNFSNVTTNFGSVISDGSNQAVSYLGFPGLKESFDMVDLSSVNLPEALDVTADVQDLTLGPVMMVVTPVPDLDSLKNSGDMSGLTDKLSQLIDVGSQLKDATDQLNSGEQAFAGGVAQLFSGINTAGASFDQIVGGAHSLNAAAGSAASGIPALVGGMGSLSSGADQIAGGLDKLYAQFGTGTEQSPTLKDSIGSLDSGAQSVSAGLDQLYSQFSPAKDGTSPTLADSIGTLNKGASAYTALSSNVLFGIVESDLQTLQSALSSAMTPALKAQGMSSDQISASVKSALSSAVSGELTNLHGAADAAVIQYLTAGSGSDKSAYYNNACEYINLYDVLNIAATDSAVVGVSDMSRKEAAFEQAMKSTSSGYFYSFDRSTLSATLAPLSLSDSQKSGLKTAADNLPDTQIKTLVNAVNGNNVVIAGANISGGMSSLASQFKTAVSGQSATLYDSLGTLDSGAKQLKAGVGALNAQTASSGDPSNPTLCDSIGALDKGAKSLGSGARSLASGASGLASLQAGIQSLTKALDAFQGGLTAIQGGASTLNDNSKKLTAGTAELSGGVSKFWDSGIGNKANFDTDKINQALQVKDELVKLSDDYTNFTGTGDGITSNVKFVMKTDEIKAVAKPSAQEAGSSSAANQSLWQKIGSWFSSLFGAKS